ncbi:hypothetical protein GCM10009078_49390 [Cupriavidus gilardii]
MHSGHLACSARIMARISALFLICLVIAVSVVVERPPFARGSGKGTDVLQALRCFGSEYVEMRMRA